MKQVYIRIRPSNRKEYWRTKTGSDSDIYPKTKTEK